VIDRTQLILDIFARHARTDEKASYKSSWHKLQYMLPGRLAGGEALRCRSLAAGLGHAVLVKRQLETGPVGRFTGACRHVEQQLDNVRRIRAQQAAAAGIGARLRTCALVGYTNAGKSTLFNALTRAGVLASSKCLLRLIRRFALWRSFEEEGFCCSDTVGFIRNLPHTLVSAFRASIGGGAAGVID